MQEDQDNLRMELKAKDTMLELAKTEKERIISKFQTETGIYPTCNSTTCVDVHNSLQSDGAICTAAISFL